MVRKNMGAILAGCLVLVGVGLLLLVIGVYGFEYPMILCTTAYGCPSIFNSYYTADWLEILTGLFFVILGVGIVIFTRRHRSVSNMDMRRPITRESNRQN